MPQKALEMYRLDNSGISSQPVPGSQVASRNRIDYRTHTGILKFTNGIGLEGFYERWVTGYINRLRAFDIGDEWVKMPDFFLFFNDSLGPAIFESICGSALLRLNPGFARDFLEYDLAIPGLLKSLPRWMIPQAYQVRDKLLDSIGKWHDFAREQSHDSSIGQDADTDPHWGSAFIRERQAPDGIFATADNFDRDARAASDLGFIWA